MERGEEKGEAALRPPRAPSLWTGIPGNARWRENGPGQGEGGLGGEVCGKAVAKRLLFENRGR